MRNQSDLPAILKLRVEVDELVQQFLFPEFLAQRLKNSLRVWSNANKRLMIVWKPFVDVSLIVGGIKTAFFNGLDIVLKI